MSKVYSFKDYDKYLCLKASSELWLVLLFLLRPLVLVILSFLLGLRGGNAAVAEKFQSVLYPDDIALTLAILTTIPALIFVYAWVKRKPGAPDCVRKICHHGASLLTLAAVLNIILIFVPLLTVDYHKIHLVGWVEIAISMLVIGYLQYSQRVKDAFADFPEEEKSGNR